MFFLGHGSGLQNGLIGLQPMPVLLGKYQHYFGEYKRPLGGENPGVGLWQKCLATNSHVFHVDRAGVLS